MELQCQAFVLLLNLSFSGSFRHLQNLIVVMADKHSRFKSEIEHGSIPYSGKFSRVQIFGIWLQSPQHKFSWVLIFVFQCQFIPVLIFALTTLPSKNAKFCNSRKFPAIRRSWLLCKQFPSVLQLLRII